MCVCFERTDHGCSLMLMQSFGEGGFALIGFLSRYIWRCHVLHFTVAAAAVAATYYQEYIYVAHKWHIQRHVVCNFVERSVTRARRHVATVVRALSVTYVARAYGTGNGNLCNCITRKTCRPFGYYTLTSLYTSLYVQNNTRCMYFIWFVCCVCVFRIYCYPNVRA